MPNPKPIKEHTAQVLAKKLQQRGLNYTAAEVLAWPLATFQLAKLWLQMGRVRWAVFMEESMPEPPANPGWPAGGSSPHNTHDPASAADTGSATF